MSTREHKFGWGIIAIAGAILIWLLSRGSQVVSAIVGSLPVDPVTGCPQFDSTNPVSLPPNFTTAVAPVCGSNIISGPTNTPGDARTCGCPSGYQLMKDVAYGKYYCVLSGSIPESASPQNYSEGG